MQTIGLHDGTTKEDSILLFDKKTAIQNLVKALRNNIQYWGNANYDLCFIKDGSIEIFDGGSNVKAVEKINMINFECSKLIKEITVDDDIIIEPIGTLFDWYSEDMFYVVLDSLVKIKYTTAVQRIAEKFLHERQG